MSIKVIKGQEPWEVMKAASEGGRVAARNDIPPNFDWIEQSTPAWNWKQNMYAIIDESQPIIAWDEFDWGFFRPYGGVPSSDFIVEGGPLLPIKLQAASGHPKGITLRESPLYPWTGGECPVPGGVEVEIILRDSLYKKPLFADNLNWSHRGADDDIIAFRLTGEIR